MEKREIEAELGVIQDNIDDLIKMQLDIRRKTSHIQERIDFLTHKLYNGD